MPIRLKLAESLRPVIRTLPRGQITALKLLGLYGDHPPALNAFKGDGRRQFTDKDIGCRVCINLLDLSGRYYYLTGRYFDRIHPLLLSRLLHTGDTFIDIGANMGIHSLRASRLVGATGRVYSIEPHPVVFAILQEHLRMNDCANSQCFNLALSDTAGRLTLSGEAGHTAIFSLRKGTEGSIKLEVPVQRGDAVIPSLPESGTLLIKIDTEGHELQVLRGMGAILDRRHTYLSVELTDSWLRESGGSAMELVDFMQARGYKPYILDAEPKGWSMHNLGLVLRPFDQPSAEQQDALFMREEDSAPLASAIKTR